MAELNSYYYMSAEQRAAYDKEKNDRENERYLEKKFFKALFLAYRRDPSKFEGLLG
jgi:hypothetical protein